MDKAYYENDPRGPRLCSANEASELFRYGTQSHSAFFSCPYCDQSVQLKGANSYYVNPYFAHLSYFQDKECEERRGNDSEYVEPDGRNRDRIIARTESNFNLPIRLKFNYDGEFSLEIGLVHVPDDLWKRLGDFTIRIEAQDRILNDVWKTVGTYGKFRIDNRKTYYLSIRDNPAPRYRLCIVWREGAKTAQFDKDTLKRFWRTYIYGIDRLRSESYYYGAVFSTDNGKKIPEWGAVEVGKKYWILTNRALFSWLDSIQVGNVYRGKNGWKIYDLTITRIDHESRDFLRDYRCIPVEQIHRPFLLPIWPTVIQHPYWVKYFSIADRETLFFYMQGEAEPYVYPKGRVEVSRTSIGSAQTLLIERINKAIEVRLGLGGDKNVSFYSNVGQDNVAFQKESSFNEIVKKVHVQNESYENVAQGEKTRLPKNGVLYVKAPYDGYARVMSDGRTVAKFEIKSGVELSINNIQYGCAVEVFQGLDCVWRVAYREEKKHESKGSSTRGNRFSANIKLHDRDLYEQLVRCGGEITAISHSFGSIAEKLAGFPLTTTWLRGQIREGKISRQAYELLRKVKISK